jgi:hypothetical protein
MGGNHRGVRTSMNTHLVRRCCLPLLLTAALAACGSDDSSGGTSSHTGGGGDDSSGNGAQGGAGGAINAGGATTTGVGGGATTSTGTGTSSSSAASGSSSSGGTGACASLDACCQTLSAQMYSACETVVSQGNDATCQSIHDTYVQSGYCTGGNNCALLEQCCPELPPGPGWQDTCTYYADLNNDPQCAMLISDYQLSGYCQ